MPDVIEKGTKVSSLIKVKGFRNTIHWEVTDYDEPHRIEMCGKGFGGVQISLRIDITDDRPGHHVPPGRRLSGARAQRAGRRLVARVIKGDVKRSVENLASLQ